MNKKLDEAIKSGTASMLRGTETGRSLSDAMKVLSSTTASADDKARALKSALDALSGGTINLEAAQARMFETLDRLGSAFGENLDKTKGWGTELNNAGHALINADGSINVTTENGRTLSRTLQDLSTHTAEVSQKTYDMAISQGETVPAATAKAQAAMQSARDAFIATKTAMGLTADEAGVLADKAGLIPKNVAMLITSPGSDVVKTELFLIKAAVDKIPPGKSVTMQTISAEAEQKLNELGFHVTHMPDGTVRIDGNTAPAQAALNGFLSAPATKVVQIVYRGEDAFRTPGGVIGNALGNIIPGQQFADGGMSMRPFRAGTAQMFPPRLLRITGDRMVDDEAYIPVNRSARSQSLLQETASRMGYDLIRRFAVGGFASDRSFGTASAPLSLDGMAITGRLRLDGDGFASLVDAKIERAMSGVAREAYLRGGRR